MEKFCAEKMKIKSPECTLIPLIMLCKAVLSLECNLLFISLYECLGVLDIISLYGALSLCNPAHLQVHFSLHCRIIGAMH